MSFYSGFANKNQEKFYNRLVFKFCQLMQDTLITKFNNEYSLTDIPFMKKIIKINRTMAKLEETRFNQPPEAFLSNSFAEMANLFSEYGKSHFEHIELSR